MSIFTPFKQAATRLLDRQGYKLIVAPSGGAFRICQDQSLEMLLAELEGHLNLLDFVFLQVGGFDGKMSDPIHPFVKKYQWKGVICEPQPEAFLRLRETYATCPNVALENVAIDSAETTRPFYYLGASNRSDVPDWAYGLGSFSPDHIERASTGIADVQTLVREIRVQCLTPTSVLQKHQLDRVDVLQIDTEGHDFEILKLIDFSLIRPWIVRYEHKVLSLADKAASVEMLVKHGYLLQFDESDVMAYRT